MAGAVFWNGLYLVLRSFLARAIFDPLFEKYSSSPLTVSRKVTSKESDNDNTVEFRRLSFADVVELSERLVGLAHSVLYNYIYGLVQLYCITVNTRVALVVGRSIHQLQDGC